MSFCIRSISNSSRYVPTFVASAQGCTTRQFNTQQSKKHAKPATTSTFLNKFLGYNAPPTSSLESKDDYKLSTIRKESNLYSNSLQIKHLIDLSKNNVKSANGVYRFSNNENYELLPQVINQTFCINSVRDQLIFSNYSGLTDSQTLLISKNENSEYENYRINFTNAVTCTKDKTKTRSSTILKNASFVKNSDSSNSSVQKKNGDKKSDDLEEIYNVLSVDLPRLFTKTCDYRIYHPDIEFVNNIKGKTIKGLSQYMKEITTLRVLGYIRFTHVNLDVLKITMHTYDSTIKVRWRIVGVTAFKVFLNFWKYKMSTKPVPKDTSKWYDGFSTFYIGKDGLIFKHVVDKVMPNQDVEEIKAKNDLSSKLATQLSFSRFN